MIIRLAMEQSAVSDLHSEYIWHDSLPNGQLRSIVRIALIHVTHSSRPRSDTASDPTNIHMALCSGDTVSFQTVSYTHLTLPTILRV